MATAAVVRAGRGSERRFFGGIAWVILATVVAGFARSFFLRPWFPEFRVHTPPETYFYVHGAIFATWFLLLAVQPTLIAAHRVDLHRKLGWFGAALAVVMVGVGFEGALIAARRPTGFMGVPVPPSQFMIIPIGDVLMFGLFVALAILRRSDPQAHKRFMLLAAVNLLDAAMARILLPFLGGNPLLFFGAADLFIVALAAWDLASRRRIHRVTLVGGLATVACQLLRLVFSGTAAWGAIAAWLLGG
jgi:hypothetical protein